MPPYKSAGVTIDYLTNVQENKFWCPLYTELKVRSCYDQPTKDLVFKQIEIELQKNGNKPFGLSDGSKASSEWLIQCLSTLNPDHEFFGKYFQSSGLKRANQPPVISS